MLQLLQHLTFVVGLCLLGIFAQHHVSAFLYSRAALHVFAAQQSDLANQSGVGQADRVDVTLWSANRIRAYEESLARSFPLPVAVLQIPKIGLRVPVFEGTEDEILDRGAGRILGTAQAGQGGNIGIAGHRDGFFRGLQDAQPGDVLELVLLDGVEVYRVDQIEIVDPTAVRVLQPRGVDAITLVTCYPFYFIGSAPRRFVVQGTMVSRVSRMNAKASGSSEKGEHHE